MVCPIPQGKVELVWYFLSHYCTKAMGKPYLFYVKSFEVSKIDAIILPNLF